MELWISHFIQLIVLLKIFCDGARLNNYIRHYESLKYDSDHIHHQHDRVRRSLLPDHSEVSIEFDSHGKSFHLMLKRDTTTISHFVKVEMPAHLGTLDTSHIYDGSLQGEPTAKVWGSLDEGVFEGVIDSRRIGTYYVERAQKYFPRHNSTEAGFHSVIYHDDNVEDPYNQMNMGCGVTGNLANHMESVQYSALQEEPLDNTIAEDSLPDEYHKMVGNLASHSKNYGHMYKEQYNKLKTHLKNDFLNSYKNHSRSKRAVRGVGANNRGTCTLSIQTDPMLWHVLHGNDNKLKNAVKTRDEITALISQHVKAINNIYGDVIFEGRYKHQGIRFEVQRIKIDDDSSCKSSERDINKFCRRNVDVSNFLNLHSQTNHDDFCLSYVFTFRDFTGGTLGLAWVASPSGASGGICEKYKTYTENLAGFRHTEQRSLNTGIITFLNYNSRVPPKVSQLTLAHEIGHNFGSPHDYPDACKPGGLKGNYIMFSSATSGDRPNNSKFSPCSVRNITKVLDAIVENSRKNCFQESDGAFCGNKIVEEGEECDCGYDDTECGEPCCYPKLISDFDLKQNASARPCTRRGGTQCSPSEGPCCDRSSCKFIQQNQCHKETDCTQSSGCNGNRATCPSPRAKNNLTYCNEDTKVCIKGECSGSICLAHNMQECFLTSDNVQDKKKLCEIACTTGINMDRCSSTSELSQIFRKPVFMRPGAPCNNFQGYCDVFQKCRAVDAEGPLARLKNLLFSEDTLNSLSEWVTQYWYGVMLIGVAFIIIMGLFIKCCAVYTPSSNPNKRAARSISETLRRPVNTLRRVKRQRNSHVSNSQGQGSRSQQPLQQGNRDRSEQQLQNQPGPSRSSRSTREVASAASQEPPRNSRAFADEPPPPYPGNKPPTRHGYGEGRGHYNRPKGTRRQENSVV